jgi:hypothetical protein
MFRCLDNGRWSGRQPMKEYRITFYIGGAVPVTADMRCDTEDQAVRCAEAIGQLNGWPVALFLDQRLVKSWFQDERLTS